MSDITCQPWTFSKSEGTRFLSEGEETLESKMLAFEEMRKRLEAQHAQQLSLLVAEQEREQEQLQKVSPRCAACGAGRRLRLAGLDLAAPGALAVPLTYLSLRGHRF